MILADSILQPASIARCVSVAVTATDHTTFNPSAQAEARRDCFFAAIRTGERSYALGGKSSGPNTWRISVSPSQPGQCFLCSSMKRNAPSIASFFDFNSKTAYPPTTSLASVKGPSIAATCPRESRTRVLTAVGASPPLATIVPALTASSLSFAIASMSSLGGGPEFSACLTNIMNRIVLSPFSFRLGAKFLDGVRRLNPGSTYASNRRQQDRQVPQYFWTDLPMPRWVPAAVIADGHVILSPPVQAGVRRNYFFAALLSRSDWARRRFSCSLSSGVNSGPKSAASNTRRISTSVSSL